MAQNKKIRILLTGGGSGGHVYPLLAVTEALRAVTASENISAMFFFMGPKDRYRSMFDGFGVSSSPILAGKYRRYFSPLNVLDAIKFFLGTIQAFFKMFLIMPDVIFSKGGPGALSVVFAGWFFRIPIVIHESDVTPGVTNMLSSIFARRILVSFEATLKLFSREKTIFTGNPGRRSSEKPVTPEEAKQRLGFDPKKPLTMFLGGSQGSAKINEFVVSNLTSLLQVTQIAHQTGEGQFAEIEKLARAARPDVKIMKVDVVRIPSLGDERTFPYQISPYLENEFELVFIAADAVVSRVGSGAISTIAAFGKPSILIPHPLPASANDHQRANAYEYAKSGAAKVIEEVNLVHEIFVRELSDIIEHADVREKMEAAARASFNPQIPETIAKEILAVVG